MSYRNVTVEGRNYQYSVGKKNVHVRGLGDFKAAEIGDMVEGWYVVTPRCIANAIKSLYECKRQRINQNQIVAV